LREKRGKDSKSPRREAHGFFPQDPTGKQKKTVLGGRATRRIPNRGKPPRRSWKLPLPFGLPKAGPHPQAAAVRWKIEIMVGEPLKDLSSSHQQPTPGRRLRSGITHRRPRQQFGTRESSLLEIRDRGVAPPATIPGALAATFSYRVATLKGPASCRRGCCTIKAHLRDSRTLQGEPTGGKKATLSKTMTEVPPADIINKWVSAGRQRRKAGPRFGSAHERGLPNQEFSNGHSGDLS